MRTPSRFLLVGLLLAGLALGGCGDDEDEPPATTPSEATASPTATASAGASPTEEASPSAGGLALTASEPAEGEFAFDPDSLSAPTGEVTITMTNPEDNSAPHNVAIEGNGVDEAGEIVQPGGDSTVTATLEPGEYTFYCAVGQHRQNGMEGTLTVE